MNTDLLDQRHEYLYKKRMAWLKLNEIISVIKMGNFNKDGQIKVRGSFSKSQAEEVLQLNILQRLWKFNKNAKLEHFPLRAVTLTQVKHFLAVGSLGCIRLIFYICYGLEWAQATGLLLVLASKGNATALGLCPIHRNLMYI